MEGRQRYWEDIQLGEEVPGFSLKIDATRMALLVSGSQDFNPLHHDKDFARSIGHRDVFLNTGFMQGCFNRLVCDWIGDDGSFRSFKMEMRKMNNPGDTVTLKGKVTATYIHEGDHYVDLDVWAENQREGITTPSKATVILPSRLPPSR